MTGQSLLTVWSDSALISALIWIVVALVLLYLARRPAHDALRNLGRTIHRALRLTAHSVMRLEERLARRNREVLIAMGEEHQERLIEREFHRVSTVVARDLGNYPALHRTLSEQITRIDEDYSRSTEVPPAPPAWLEAVDAVANIPSKDDPAVNKILEDIHGTLERSCHNTVMEYRAASHRRHKLLRRMLPYWRRLRDTLEQVNSTITGIEERSHQIDRHMQRYEAVRADTDPMARTLSSSSLTQFLIAGLVLAIAALGVFINFNLVARPMAEMVGGLGGTGTGMLAGFPVADVAAMFIVLLEVFLGIFLMELLRVTRLFPVIGSWDDRKRVALAWITFFMLLTIALVEASLAFQRDHLAAQDQALRQYLIEGQGKVLALSFRWIPAVTQMVMGFLLPFALTFVAVPLESFIHSGRTVIGAVGIGLLRLTAYLLRLLGNLSRSLAELLIRVYDLAIFLPLAVEYWVRGMLGQRVGAETGVEAKAAAAAGPGTVKGRRNRSRSTGRGRAPQPDGGEQNSEPASGDAEART